MCHIDLSQNETNDFYISDDANIFHKYYAPFILSNNKEDESAVIEYDSSKCRGRNHKNILLDILLNK